jgi:hypothetical protein
MYSHPKRDDDDYIIVVGVNSSLKINYLLIVMKYNLINYAEYLLFCGPFWLISL